MAATFDIAGATSPNSSASPLTWTHVNSGNCILVWTVNSDAASNPVTAVTYGGVTLPLIKAQQTGQPLGGVAFYGLAGGTVPTGSNTVSVTFTTGSGDQIGGSISASGVGSIGTPVSASNSGTTNSFTVTLPSTTSGGLVVVGCSFGGGAGGGSFSGVNGVTVRISDVISSASPADNMGVGTIASTGSSMSPGLANVGQGNGDWIAMAAVELLPAGTLSGPNSPSTGTDLGGGTGSWTSPGNITADDGSAATWAVV